MREWVDYTSTQQRRMPLAMKKRLMRKHLVSWIKYWCAKQGGTHTGFVRLLDRLLRLERRK